MGLNLKFTEDDWGNLEQSWSAWWAGELDRPMVMMETFNSLFYVTKEVYTPEFLLHKPVGEVLDYFEQYLAHANWYADAWPKVFFNHGPGIVAGFLGSRVDSMPDQNTIWFEADEVKPVSEISLAYDPENKWWKRVKELTAAAVDRWGDKISVAHTDLGGNLDIMASFRTSDKLLYDLYDFPEEVNRVSREITEAWKRYYLEQYEIIKPAGRGTSNWAAVWSPGKTCMHQSDFCYMISPKMFEEFVMPDLDAIFSIMDHASYHLDGIGQIPHLDYLLEMDNLACIQWIPGSGQKQAEEWIDLLKKIIDGGKRCQVFVSAEGARKIVKEIGGKGFALYVVNPMSPEQADDYLKLLASEDISF